MTGQLIAPPESLTRAKVVILTGAGASVPLGLPSTAEFLEIFKQQGVRERIPAAATTDDLAGFVTDRLHVSNPADIEHVLARVEGNAAWANRLASDPFFLRVFVESEERDLATLAAGANMPLSIDELRRIWGFAPAGDHAFRRYE